MPLRAYDSFNIIQEVAEYYDSNSLVDTQKRYNVSRSTIDRYYKRTYGVPKNKKHRLENNKNGYKDSC